MFHEELTVGTLFWRGHTIWMEPEERANVVIAAWEEKMRRDKKKEA